jgi:hypothetical protein
MSQAGLIDIEGSNPQIPTQFDTDNNPAIPINNILEVLGGAGIETFGSGNTVTIALTGGGAGIDEINVDASTAPGTNPVLPTALGAITVTGSQVSSNAIGANVIRTNSLAANSYVIQVQQAGAIAVQNTTFNGVAHFNSSHFSVANGFVSLLGGGQGIDSFTTDINSPVTPDTNGNVAFTGATNVFSDGSASNTMRLNLQGTNHALFVGRGTNTASANLAVGSTNTVLLGNTGADPSFGQVANAALVNSSITFNNGNNITWTGSPVSLGGNITANLTGTTNHAVQVGNASGNLTSLSVGTNGQVLIAATSADPAFATVGTNANMNTVTGANSLTLNPYNCAKWIVDSTSNIGTHTTIAAALTAASSGDTIFIRPGTYTQDLTLKAGVNLSAFSCDAFTPNVTILGKCSFSGVGTVSISGIRLQTNSDNFLAVTGSSASAVNFINCYLNCTNTTGISYTTASASSIIQFFGCSGDLGTTGIAFYSMSSTGTLRFVNCDFTNSGASTTASSNSAGILAFRNTRVKSPISTTSTASITFDNSAVDCSAQNVTALTHGGSVTSTTSQAILNSGSASAISIGTGATLSINCCTVGSSNTNAITGIGTVNIDGIAFNSTSSTINTTTQNLQVFDGGEYKGRASSTAPAAGMIGEILTANASAVSMTSTVAKTITSISLTPGIWDVSGMASSTATGGTSTMTLFIIGISATNNTVSGTLGIDYYQLNSSAVVTLSGTTIPVRVSLSATTTYYVVVNTIFSSTTCPTNGIIRAVRVG